MSVNGNIWFNCKGYMCESKDICQRYISFKKGDENPTFAETPTKDNGKCHLIIYVEEINSTNNIPVLGGE